MELRLKLVHPGVTCLRRLNLNILRESCSPPAKRSQVCTCGVILECKTSGLGAGGWGLGVRGVESRKCRTKERFGGASVA